MHQTLVIIKTVTGNDAFEWEAWIPDRSDLAEHLIGFLGYSIMLKGPRFGYELRSGMYANSIDKTDAKQLHRRAINASKSKDTYWLIVLPDPRYQLVNAFSKGAKMIDAKRTSSCLKASDRRNILKKEQRCVAVTWYVALDQGSSIESPDKTLKLDNTESDDEDENNKFHDTVETP